MFTIFLCILTLFLTVMVMNDVLEVAFKRYPVNLSFVNLVLLSVIILSSFENK